MILVILILKTKNNKSPVDPDRSDRINALKEQIEQGIYKIDIEKVAQAMIDDLIKKQRPAR